MLWGIYSAIYGEVNVSVEKCVEIKGDYVEKQQSCFISVTSKSWSGRKLLDPTTYVDWLLSPARFLCSEGRWLFLWTKYVGLWTWLLRFVKCRRGAIFTTPYKILQQLKHFSPVGTLDISAVRIAQQSGNTFCLVTRKEKGESLETFTLASLYAKIFATCRPWGISNYVATRVSKICNSPPMK